MVYFCFVCRQPLTDPPMGDYNTFRCINPECPVEYVSLGIVSRKPRVVQEI